jgi:serine/threonine protein kinase
MTGLLSSQSLLHGGRYRILEMVGRGGMGAVYKASDLQLHNRIVAIKEMSQDGLAGQELQDAIASFTREAELLTHLSHPGLPHIYEQFEDNGRRYLVMEFIEGETLEELLEHFHKQGTHIPLSLAIDIGKKLCTVLGYLHSQQPPIIFRDLKPSNIMLDSQGLIYLIDFGIARLFKPGQTRDTIALGSPGYAPPEQYRGATSPHSDIYSLGATLHQMLTGIDPVQHPFLFQPFSVNNPRLEHLIQSMVSLEEHQRPASMLTVHSTLADLTLNPQSPPKQMQQKQISKRRAPRQYSRDIYQTNNVGAGLGTKTQEALHVSVIVSSNTHDQYLWQRIYQQMIPLLDGFPAIEFRLEMNTRAIDDADLVLLLLSESFLTSAECMAAANQAIDRYQTQGIGVLSIKLSPCLLAGTRLEHMRTTPEHTIAHLSFYAQEQRILEVAKLVRSLLVQQLLAGKSSGPMNLLQWLLWQLYGNGLSSCRYFFVGPYMIKHVRPSGLSGILLHLFDLRKDHIVAEYMIGPLCCRDLLRLLHSIDAPTTDSATVQGIATRSRSTNYKP